MVLCRCMASWPVSSEPRGWSLGTGCCLQGGLRALELEFNSSLPTLRCAAQAAGLHGAGCPQPQQAAAPGGGVCLRPARHLARRGGELLPPLCACCAAVSAAAPKPTCLPGLAVCRKLLNLETAASQPELPLQVLAPAARAAPHAVPATAGAAAACTAPVGRRCGACAGGTQVPAVSPAPVLLAGSGRGHAAWWHRRQWQRWAAGAACLCSRSCCRASSCRRPGHNRGCCTAGLWRHGGGGGVAGAHAAGAARA